MANLIIKKSDTENISIPLTTEKPIARSLAVFKDGKIYYNPLVHSGEYLDSGVKVRIGDTDYALSTEIYEPTEYDSLGRQWYSPHKPIIVERGKCFLFGDTYFNDMSSYSLNADSYIYFQCDIRLPPKNDNTSPTYPIFRLGAGSRYINLFIDSTRKITLIVGGTSLFNTSLDESEPTTRIGFEYKDRKFYLLDRVFLIPYSGTKTVAADEYELHLGSISNRNFIGEMSNVCININGQASYLRFGG